MHTIKLARAAKISQLSPNGLARYPRTWAAVISAIPADIKKSLTAKQIAALAQAMRAQYEHGHNAGYRDAA